MTVERTGAGDHIDWLDYARLLSALSVMGFHYLWGSHAAGILPVAFERGGAIAHLGYLGVDFFFLISGYVIMLSASGRSASAFAASRLVRLAPAFLFCMSLTWLVIRLWGGPLFSVAGAQWLANLTLHPSALGFDYVDPSYWTLYAEVLFYGFVFLLLLAGQARWLERWIFAWLAIQIVAWAAGSEEFLLVGVFPLFVVGCLLYFGEHRGWTLPRMIGLGLSLALSIIVETIRGLDTLLHDPAAPIWAVGAALTLFVVAFLAFGRWRPSLPYATRLGALTYPLYLLHQVIGVILITALAPLVGKYAAVTITMLAMLTAAYLVSEYIETRLRPLWKRIAKAITGPVTLLESRLAEPLRRRHRPT